MLGTLKTRLRQILIRTPLWDIRQARKDRLQKTTDQTEIATWQKNGRQVPPPETIKRRTLAAYGLAFHLDTLIETGTFMGGTMHALKDNFKELYSIELSPDLVARAKRRFRHQPNIHILQGDSGKVLPGLMCDVTAPCLFWLDGHYSGGGTAQAHLDTPIIQELGTIFDHPVSTHVILIDDARLFDGTHDYPTIEQLRKFFAEKRPQYHFSVVNDIIRAHPPGTIDDPFRPQT